MDKKKRTYKEHKTHVQAWLVHDASIDPEQSLAVEIWQEQRQNHQTSEIMTQALIAYGEKLTEGFRPVRDETPKIAKQMKESIQALKDAVGKLANLNLQAVSQSDAQSVMDEIASTADAIDFNIFSDSMTFDDES